MIGTLQTKYSFAFGTILMLSVIDLEVHRLACIPGNCLRF